MDGGKTSGVVGGKAEVELRGVDMEAQRMETRRRWREGQRRYEREVRKRH